MYRYSTLLFFLLFASHGFAQDIRGGEIQFTHVSGLTYQFDIYLYTQTSMGISHDSIEVNVGDGSNGYITGASTILANDVTEWHYTTTHTYTGPGTYLITAKDSFRVAGTQNIPNSDLERITLRAELVISPFAGVNSSPTLNNSQQEVHIIDGNFFHSPKAVDADNDSLVFELVPTTSSNYSTPTGAAINSANGYFTMPVNTGSYAIAIEISEYRSDFNAIYMGTTYREMLIDSSIASSIEPVQKEVNIKLYPNPTSGSFVVKAPHKEQFTVTDAQGRLITTGNYNEQTNLSKEASRISSGGVYFVNLHNGETRKLVLTE